MTSAVPSRPYRTLLREASAEEIEAQNIAERREGPSLLRSAEDSIALTKTSLLSLSSAEVDALIKHPDERVRLAFINAFCNSRKGALSDNQERMLRSLLDSSEKEGLAWTPLIDLMALESTWRASSPHPTSAREQALKMGEWLATQATEQDFEEMLSNFRSPDLIEAVAEAYRDLTPEMVSKIFEWSPASGEAQSKEATPARSLSRWQAAVLRNRQLPPETVEHLFSRGLSHIESRPMLVGKKLLLGLVRTGYDMPDEVRRSLARKVKKGPPEGVIPLEILLKDPRSSIQVLEFLRPYATAPGHATLLSVHPAASAAMRNQILDSDPEIASRIIEFQGRVPPPLLEEVYKRSAEDITVFRSLLLRRDIPVPLISQIARDAATYNRVEALRLLSRRNDLRQREEVRSVLRGRQETDILLSLLSDERADDFAVVFRRIIKQSPLDAQMVLRSTTIPSGSGLTPADLAPLLQSNDQDTRLSAIAAVGQLARDAANLSTSYISRAERSRK